MQESKLHASEFGNLFTRDVVGVLGWKTEVTGKQQLEVEFVGGADCDTEAGREYELVDNVSVAIADFEKALQLADGFDARELHHVLARAACAYSPVIKTHGVDYHFSLMRARILD